MTAAVKVPRGLHAKLAEIYAAVTNIEKLGHAPAAMGGFAFTQAADIAAAIRKELSERSITMLPESMFRADPQTITTKNGSTLLLEHMQIRWRITDGESGETCTTESWGSGSDVGDKAIPKAITNAMKYGLLAGFLVPQGDDPEREDQVGANGGAQNPGFRPAPARPAPAPVFAVPDDSDALDMRDTADRIFAQDRAPSSTTASSGPLRAAAGVGSPVGGRAVCDRCGAPYAGKPGDYWHRADDGTIHRPSGQPRRQ